MKQFLVQHGKLLLEILTVLAVLLMMAHPVEGDAYRRVVSDSQYYLRATVEEVVSQELSESLVGSGQQLGTQQLRMKLSDGTEVEVDNYLTETHNILAQKGSRLIVCVDAPEGVAPYYTIFNYDRLPTLLLLVGVFLALMLAVGRRKGFDAALAIGFTLSFLLCVMVPAIYNGGSPLGLGFLTVLLSTAVSLALLHGFSMQCGLAICVTLLGEGVACLLFGVFSALLHLTGFQTDSAESLLLIAQNTGLQVHTLLFAGTMISSLGAVMDVAVSILSSLREVAGADRKQGLPALFAAGSSIGRDMIGTMSNTLIFAFAGGALTTILVLYSYGVQFNQLISSDYLTIELAQGLCSTAAVILTVPLAALFGAAAYGKK